MAYTEIHAIKATINKAIDYICDPEKTAERFLVSSFACAPETAAIDFAYILDHCRSNGPNQAYHLIQSFLPGEVSYEEAHRIGVELADKILEGKYAYVVTTHIDKEHCHNHIIFCAADHINFDKYHACKKSYYRIRNLSDELCREHHLSVIEPGEKRGKKHIEWQAEKTNSSWKSAIRKDINTSIRASASYDEFLQIMKSKGYEIKGESLQDEAEKYISFRPEEKERFVRGSVKSLGKEYTKERIKERIDSGLEHNYKIKPKERANKELIDVNQDKFASSPGQKRWAAVENLKNIAESYHAAGSITELAEKQTEIRTETLRAKNNLRNIENRIKQLQEILKYVNQYHSTLSTYQSYKKAKNPDVYFQKHESEIILYGGAKRMLEQAGINVKNMDVEKLKAELLRLEAQKKEHSSTYKMLAKNEKELQKQMQKLSTYINTEKEQSHEKKQEQKREKHSL